MTFSIKNKADFAHGSVCLVCLRLLGVLVIQDSRAIQDGVVGVQSTNGWSQKLGTFRKRFFFSKDRLNWGKYEMLKILWISKIEIWSEELIDGHQIVPYEPGALFRGGQLCGSVLNPF